MKNTNFKISDLKRITPDSSYKENAKKRFLNSVRSTSFSDNKNTYKNPIIVPIAFKRIALSFATFSFVFAVCGSVVYSASDDLPGDFLYPVKIVTEKVRFVFTFSPEAKMDLELEIASKRFAEFSQYLDSSSENLSDPKSKKVVASVVSEIDGSIIRLSNKIDNMHNNKSTSSETLIVARMIGDKIGEYNKALVDTKGRVLDTNLKEIIDKVEMNNNKIAIRALKVAASQVERDVKTSEKDEIISSVSSRAIAKIDDIQNSVSDNIIWDELVLEGKKEESVKIKERLEDAKKLLASADVDLSYALQVVEDIITDHENYLKNNDTIGVNSVRPVDDDKIDENNNVVDKNNDNNTVGANSVRPVDDDKIDENNDVVEKNNDEIIIDEEIEFVDKDISELLEEDDIIVIDVISE